jgi:hypothetical protein
MAQDIRYEKTTMPMIKATACTLKTIKIGSCIRTINGDKIQVKFHLKFSPELSMGFMGVQSKAKLIERT